MCFSIKTIKHILMTWCIPIVFNTDTFGQFHTVLTLPAAWWSCELMGPFFRSCNCMCFSVKTYPGALNPQCKQVRVPLQQVPRLLRENYAALSSSSKQHKPLYEVTPPSHIPYTSAAAVLPLPTQTPLEIWNFQKWLIEEIWIFTPRNFGFHPKGWRPEGWNTKFRGVKIHISSINHFWKLYYH